MFLFSVTSRNLLISSFISLMTHSSLSNVLFSFQLFMCFVLMFLLLTSSFNALWSDTMYGIISIFLYLVRLALCPKIWSILEKVPWAAETNVYLQRLDEIFCRHQLGPFALWFDLVLEFSLLIFCLDDLSVGDKGVLKSPTTTVLESIHAFRSFRVCLMKLGVLKLGAYRLIIVISFWCSSPFISMECPPCLITISLKSTLSKISIATAVCFQGPLAW
jgi:hypothetical protein